MQNLFAGLLLLLIAMVAAWQALPLDPGTLRHLGPGMVPLTLSAVLASFGVALLWSWFAGQRDATGHWPLRGPVFILGAAVVFGLAVRPLGLVVAGPLLVGIAGLASGQTRWAEVGIFAVGMTAFCLALFKYLLSLPIPVAPWLIGY